MATVFDENGNGIIVEKNGNFLSVSLQLKEKKSRNIGTIDSERWILSVKRIREKHLFRKNQSYGFNFYVLDNAKKFDQIYLSDEHNNWLIPRKFILENGVFLNFKELGFERQIFITLEKLKEFEYELV